MLNAVIMYYSRLKVHLVSRSGIQDHRVDEIDHSRTHIELLHTTGPRFTGSDAHGNYVAWLQTQLEDTPNLEVFSQDVEILGWQPQGSLEESATLTILKDDGLGQRARIAVAGAVPYTLPSTGRQGGLIYVPRHQKISGHELNGKMILRDFPVHRLPYAVGMIPAYYMTSDMKDDLLDVYDRPGFADQVIHQDLLDAGNAQVAGVLFMFDVPRDQVASYFEPHKGTHHQIPAAYVGVEESIVLKNTAMDLSTKASATLSVKAKITKTTARALKAVLPGQIEERVIYVTHTDGNTCVQENGPVALLALARYFATRSNSPGRRTIEFAFNVRHLHISREGSLAQAKDLDASFDHSSGMTTLVIPIEHLGTREIEAVHEQGEPGRRLCYTGRGKPMFWCVGPNPPVVQAVIAAVSRRRLDRVIVTRGVSTPRFNKTPVFTSFGGIGTYYHNLLLPTTSLISGPWSLWAPSFGPDAVDVCRLRQQTLALGDVYDSLETVSRQEIVQGYIDYRKERSMRGKSWTFSEPPKKAEAIETLESGAIQY
ncbi:hypothetical protein H9Q72_005183 [Fusarium xylarioides]|uniref:Uncharacterized protein n=1 Tax=Fusarium xylarioides TaxID=221167 RepID=A0A9P7L6Y5_9HYPO|nr:hypothetical protein H9Q72_005183 [Fusarium xylarioides]